MTRIASICHAVYRPRALPWADTFGIVRSLHVCAYDWCFEAAIKVSRRLQLANATVVKRKHGHCRAAFSCSAVGYPTELQAT